MGSDMVYYTYITWFLVFLVYLIGLLHTERVLEVGPVSVLRQNIGRHQSGAPPQLDNQRSHCSF